MDGLMFARRNCPFFCLTLLLTLMRIPSAADERWSTVPKSSSSRGFSVSSISTFKVLPISAMLASSRILLLVNSTTRMPFSSETESGGMVSAMRVSRGENPAESDSKGRRKGCQASPGPRQRGKHETHHGCQKYGGSYLLPGTARGLERGEFGLPVG